MRESRIHQTPRLIIHLEEVHRVMPLAKHDELALLLQQVLDHVVDLGRPTDVDGLVAAPAQHALLRREVTVVVGVVAGVRLGLLALALASPRGVRHLDHRGRDAGLATLRIPSRQEDIKTRKHCASHRGSCILPRHHDKKALRIPSRFMHLVAVHASRRGSCIQEDIKTSRHQGIKASRHRDIKTSRHQDIKTSRHQDIKTSRHQGIKASRHRAFHHINKQHTTTIGMLRGFGGATPTPIAIAHPTLVRMVSIPLPPPLATFFPFSSSESYIISSSG